MIDLRNLTDYARDKYFTCNIPEWVYFVAFYAALGVGAWFVAGLAINLAVW